jgi:hypothetical protein
MSRYSKLLVKFNRARELLKKAAYMATLPALPYVVKEVVPPGEEASGEGLEWIDYLRGEASVRDAPGYAEHNRLHEEAARERRIPPKEYLFDPNEMEPIEFEEWPEGFPPAIPTD